MGTQKNKEKTTYLERLALQLGNRFTIFDWAYAQSSPPDIMCLYDNYHHVLRTWCENVTPMTLGKIISNNRSAAELPSELKDAIAEKFEDTIGYGDMFLVEGAVAYIIFELDCLIHCFFREEEKKRDAQSV